MKLELHSFKDDVFEVETRNTNRPSIKICEIFFDNAWHLWHCNWETLVVDDFAEDFEVVKNKIVDYYKAESLPIDGASVRKPGFARMSATEEEWELRNCKIIGCDINEEKKTIRLEFDFDGCSYKNFMG